MPAFGRTIIGSCGRAYFRAERKLGSMQTQEQTNERKELFERLYCAILTGAVQAHYSARIRFEDTKGKAFGRYMENNVAACLAEDCLYRRSLGVVTLREKCERWFQSSEPRSHRTTGRLFESLTLKPRIRSISRSGEAPVGSLLF
jgi:hypothetical protein